MHKKMLIGLVPLLAVAAMAATPVPAMAEYQHFYCQQFLAVNGTCPPNGSAEYAHLYDNIANAGGASHETCDDDYLTESGYTGADCMYYSNEYATIETVAGPYGYPRAWNGGSIEHYVQAEEFGYRTGESPLAGNRSQQLPATIRLLAQFAPGLSSSPIILSGGAPASVIASSTDVCLMDSEKEPDDVTVGVCGATSGVEQRGLALATEDATGAPVVLGLAPSGNTSVTVTDTDGKTETVLATNGVYEIASGDPSTVTLKEASGKITTRRLPKVSVPPPSAPLD